MDEHFARVSLPRQIDQNLFVDALIVELIMGTILVEPARLPGICVARENARRLFVVGRPDR
jgi:hypothetical protein